MTIAIYDVGACFFRVLYRFPLGSDKNGAIFSSRRAGGTKPKQEETYYSASGRREKSGTT